MIVHNYIAQYFRDIENVCGGGSGSRTVRFRQPPHYKIVILSKISKRMNIILIAAEEVTDGRVVLTDHRAEHIVKVLRSSSADTVRIGVINGRKGYGRILSMTDRHPHRVELSLDLQEEALPRSPLDLLLALPRPIMLKRIFSQAAALGFGSITLINANRVEKSFWEAGLLSEESYKGHLIHGLEQAVDTRLPEVRCFTRFRPFVEDVLPGMMRDYSHCLLAHPTGIRILREVLTGNPGRILLAVGPEGGWVDYEVERFLEQGFSVFTMGARILKVDTAVISLHGRVSALLE
jgi:16S rRNA (uracil1498-N3)-methyltransferase